MFIERFMIEGLRIDGLVWIPCGWSPARGVERALRRARLVRHHRWILCSPTGELSWLWLRRCGPRGALLGNVADVRDVRSSGGRRNGVAFIAGVQDVEVVGPRAELERLALFLRG